MVLNTYPPVAGEAQCSAEGMPLQTQSVYQLPQRKPTDAYNL